MNCHISYLVKQSVNLTKKRENFDLFRPLNSFSLVLYRGKEGKGSGAMSITRVITTGRQMNQKSFSHRQFLSRVLASKYESLVK